MKSSLLAAAGLALFMAFGNVAMAQVAVTDPNTPDVTIDDGTTVDGTDVGVAVDDGVPVDDGVAVDDGVTTETDYDPIIAYSGAPVMAPENHAADSGLVSGGGNANSAIPGRIILKNGKLFKLSQ
jgi:hypothetical protein